MSGSTEKNQFSCWTGEVPELTWELGADTTEENIDRNDDSDQRDNDDNESVNVNNNDQNDTERRPTQPLFRKHMYFDPS